MILENIKKYINIVHLKSCKLQYKDKIFLYGIMESHCYEIFKDLSQRLQSLLNLQLQLLLTVSMQGL
jgi:hypothetical protein